MTGESFEIIPPWKYQSTHMFSTNIEQNATVTT